MATLHELVGDRSGSSDQRLLRTPVLRTASSNKILAVFGEVSIMNKFPQFLDLNECYRLPELGLAGGTKRELRRDRMRGGKPRGFLVSQRMPSVVPHTHTLLTIIPGAQCLGDSSASRVH